MKKIITRANRQSIREWLAGGIDANAIHRPIVNDPRFAEFTVEAGPGDESGWDLYSPGYNSPTCAVWSSYTTHGTDNDTRAENARIVAYVVAAAREWLAKNV